MTRDGAPRWFSLQGRLLSRVLGGLLLCWSITLFFSYHDALHETNEIFDAQLAQLGQTLLALAGEADEDALLGVLAGQGRHEYQMRIRVHLQVEGRPALRSAHAPPDLAQLPDGFSTRAEHHDGEDPDWRYYAETSHDRERRVIVGESLHARDELAEDIVLQMGLPMLAGLPVLALWMWLAIRSALAGLRHLAREIEGRAPEHLAALQPASAPVELRPILNALNRLFARVSSAMARERQFTGDAAHELRTPLAALTTQAEVLLRARDEAEREHAAQQILNAARRASHLVDQLLTLARLDPEQPLGALVPLSLDALLEHACALAGPAALARQHELSLDVVPTRCQANPELLATLVRNLLDNAIRYTPRGGTIRVSLNRQPGWAIVRVADDGPGIALEQRAQALTRFQRLAGQEIEGSGLGLSIVARIVELHGGQLGLEDGLRLRDTGLCAEVRLPCPDPPSTAA